MGRGHGNFVTPEEQTIFRQNITWLLEVHDMSWGQIFQEARIGKLIKDDTGSSAIEVLKDAFRGKADRPIFNAINKLVASLKRERAKMEHKNKSKSYTEAQIRQRILSVVGANPGIAPSHLYNSAGGKRGVPIRDQLVKDGQLIAEGDWPPKRGGRTRLYLPGAERKEKKVVDPFAAPPKPEAPLVEVNPVHEARKRIAEAITFLQKAAENPPDTLLSTLREMYVKELSDVAEALRAAAERLQ